MFGLTRRRAVVTPLPPDAMAVAPADGAPFTVPVAGLPWVLFAVSGDALGSGQDGWWLFARPGAGGAWALNTLCHGLEGAVRGPLRAALDGAGSRRLLLLAETPPCLRGAPARAGWAALDDTATLALAGDPSCTPLDSVSHAPTLP